MEETMQKRRVLVNYLLGELDEQKSEELAEQFFADDELFNQLIEVENDLLDQYVRGRLSADEQGMFGRYLERLPDGRNKIAVATALMKTVSEELGQTKARANRETALAEVVQPTPRPRSSWWLPSPLTSKLWPAFQYSLAIILVLLLGGGLIWALMQRQPLRLENEQLRVQKAQGDAEQQRLRQRVQELEAQVGAQQTHNEQLENALQREKQRSDLQDQEIARLPPSSFTSLTLTPASRSFSAPDTVTLAKDAKSVLLTIILKNGERYAGRPAVLQTIEGAQVQNLAGRRGRSSRQVVFRLPTASLTTINYKLTLTLVIEDGMEISPDYYFQVVKR